MVDKLTTEPFRLLIVTGLSGAGRSTCLKVLEDLDFEAVDNLPLPLLRRLVSTDEAFDRNLAVGMDTRTSGFDPAEIALLLEQLRARNDLKAELIFCECADRIIQQRYSESRRPHPMSPDRRVSDGIAMERRLLAPLYEQADIRLDTTETTPRLLRERLGAIFGSQDHGSLVLTVTSFAYRHGLPRDADLVFDVRFLRNPHYDPALKHATGLEPAVANFVRQDPDFERFTDSLLALVLPLLPRYQDEGKSYLTVAFGCTGGQHRSVFLTEWLSSQLSTAGWSAKVYHREIETKRISDAPQP